MGTLRNPETGSGRSGATSEDPASSRFWREHGYSRGPLLVQWMVTEDCPLDCGHCLTRSRRRRTSSQLELPEIATLCSELAELGVPELLLTGGEPLARPDFPEIVALLQHYQLHWSLNTAVFPNASCRAALERWAPDFVAVSIDGPRAYHDAFRGREGAFDSAMRAIRLYGELTGGNVAAGTTVTRPGFGRLEETFGEVIRSGASTWGLHLVVPEGRAARRPELRLTDHQARALIEFTASKRQYFPVVLADEIGYCGEWEPLVRPAPFFCGAGRTQCVLLSDGTLVPCTTLDRSVAVGSIRERPLRRLWHEGFGELRSHQPDARCRHCEYLPACGAGCWLQRRHGTHCFRTAWHRPRALASASGAAVCLGLAACAGAGPATDDPVWAFSGEPVEPTPAPALSASTTRPTEADAPTPATNPPQPADVDPWLLRCQRATLDDEDAPHSLAKSLADLVGDDPARAELLALMDGPWPATLSVRAERIRTALASPRPSLNLASLLWQRLAEWCMDCSPPEQRTEEERQLLRATLAELQAQTAKWRREIVRRRLDPFLVRYDASIPGIGAVSKAGDRRPRIDLHHRRALKHWGMLPGPKTRWRLTNAYLRRHPFAEHMRVTLHLPQGSGVRLASGQRNVTPGGKLAVGIFDVVAVPDGETVAVRLGFRGRGLQLVPPGRRAKVAVTQRPERMVAVELPPGTELAYVDLLQLAYEQNRALLQSGVDDTPLRLVELRGQLVERLAEGARESTIPGLRWQLLVTYLF